MPTHVYDGALVPGVTTILGRWKPGGALTQWAFKTGYQQGLNKEPPDLYKKRDAAADIGTFVHALIEWHILGECGDRPEPALSQDDVKRGLNGYTQYLRWESRTRLRIISWERPLVSELYRFGGTLDAVF